MFIPIRKLGQTWNMSSPLYQYVIYPGSPQWMFHQTAKKHPLIYNFQISSLTGPLTPIHNKPEFTKCLVPFRNLAQHRYMCRTLLLRRHFLTLSKLSTQVSRQSFPLWTYFQLWHFLHYPQKMLRIFQTTYTFWSDLYQIRSTKTLDFRHILLPIL